MDTEMLANDVRLNVLGTSTLMTLGHALDICDRMSPHDLANAVIWLTAPIAIKEGGAEVIAMTETEILPLIAKVRVSASRRSVA